MIKITQEEDPLPHYELTMSEEVYIARDYLPAL
jgi:hypothetical protein